VDGTSSRISLVIRLQDEIVPQPGSDQNNLKRTDAYTYSVKGKGSLYSITERRVSPDLIRVLCSQPAGDVNHKPGGRLPLLSARPAVTPATLKGRGCYQFRCLVNRDTMGVNRLRKTVTRQRRDCEMNSGPSAPESSTLTTRLPSHPRILYSGNNQCKKVVVLPRDVMLARYMLSSYVRPFLRLSVTRRYCIETARRIELVFGAGHGGSCHLSFTALYGNS